MLKVWHTSFAYNLWHQYLRNFFLHISTLNMVYQIFEEIISSCKWNQWVEENLESINMWYWCCIFCLIHSLLHRVRWCQVSFWVFSIENRRIKASRRADAPNRVEGVWISRKEGREANTEESRYMNKVGSKSEHNLWKLQRFLWNDKTWLDTQVFRVCKCTEFLVIGVKTIVQFFNDCVIIIVDDHRIEEHQPILLLEN